MPCTMLLKDVALLMSDHDKIFSWKQQKCNRLCNSVSC
jgi:hypothetical protein